MRWLLIPLVPLAGCPMMNCFVRGTRVDTPGGGVAIEALAIGDEVWAFDEHTRERVVAEVTALHRSPAKRVATLRVGDRVIAGVTEEHPFYDAERGQWVPARELAAGAPLVLCVNGQTRPVPLAAIEWRDEDIEVFNLSVGGPETYFAEGVLVHNKSPVYEWCVELDGFEPVHFARSAEGPLVATSLGELELFDPEACVLTPVEVAPEDIELASNTLTLAGQGSCSSVYQWTIRIPDDLEDGLTEVEWRHDAGTAFFYDVPLEYFVLDNGVETDTPLDASEVTVDNAWYRIPSNLSQCN